MKRGQSDASEVNRSCAGTTDAQLSLLFATLAIYDRDDRLLAGLTRPMLICSALFELTRNRE